ncbi:hypothetical protein QA601_02130 [Chitinispirillales bacterium ANBcel5]|uniref:hypothetical protein n=1 Tax=Cellulosispirillum alkaliphilum TaxID=3039283 RepID=UPI002A500F89|nr:hypothetical protein [Chitinispirillales bacterium ANBcel5]
MVVPFKMAPVVIGIYIVLLFRELLYTLCNGLIANAITIIAIHQIFIAVSDGNNDASSIPNAKELSSIKKISVIVNVFTIEFAQVIKPIFTSVFR